jgi:pilus assembly protein CpaE
MKQARKILLAGAGDELRLMLDRAATGLPAIQIDEAPNAEPLTLNGKAVACDVLLVEVDLNSAASTDAFARLAAATTERKIIAAARNAGPEDVRRLFRAGAADVLTTPFTAGALQAALGEILQTSDNSGASGRIITVVRGCGGAGATTVALNLATLMGRPQRKSPQSRKSTALLDLDLQFGDADLALNLEPRSTLVDVLRAEQRFDGRLLQSAMVEHSSGLRLLAAPPKLVPLDALTSAFASRILAQSAQLHDYTFVDLPNVWTDWTLQILRQSCLLILLAPPTVQGAIGAKRVLEAMGEADVETPTLFVLNKLAGVVEAFEKPSRIGKSLNRTVDAVLSLDATATRAFDRGVLLADAFPNARLTRELRALAAKIELTLTHAEQRQIELTGAAA